MYISPKSLQDIVLNDIHRRIKDRPVYYVQDVLNLWPGREAVLTKPCAEVILARLSDTQRFELDVIPDFELASRDYWCKVQVLYLGCAGLSIWDKDQICEGRGHYSGESSVVSCTQSELNKAIRSKSPNTCPQRFLEMVVKCTDLKTVVWEAQFARLIDDRFFRALDECLKLEHVQGPSELRYRRPALKCYQRTVSSLSKIMAQCESYEPGTWPDYSEGEDEALDVIELPNFDYGIAHDNYVFN
jgi:hypothetical protein